MSEHDPGDSGKRRRLDSVIPEIIKRAVEKGVEKAVEAPHDLRTFVNDLRLPKEIASYIFTQVDDTKNGLFRVVAKEIRDFLEHTNFTGEVQKILTTVQFEVNTTIRFTPNDGRDKPADGDGEGGEGKDETKTGGGAPADGAQSSHSSMPKPEVRTQVNVRRDERRRRSRP